MNLEMQLVGSIKLGIFKKIQMIRVGNDLFLISSDLFRSRIIKRFDPNRFELGNDFGNRSFPVVQSYNEDTHKNTREDTIDNSLEIGGYTGANDNFMRNLKRLKKITSNYYGGER